MHSVISNARTEDLGEETLKSLPIDLSFTYNSYFIIFQKLLLKVSQLLSIVSSIKNQFKFKSYRDVIIIILE